MGTSSDRRATFLRRRRRCQADWGLVAGGAWRTAVALDRHDRWRHPLTVGAVDWARFNGREPAHGEGLAAALWAAGGGGREARR